MIISYSPKIVTAEEVRDFFNPRLEESEYPDQQLLAKIKAVEYEVNADYRVSLSDTDEKISQAVIMLVASRIGAEPKVIQKRVNLTRESWVTEKKAGEEYSPFKVVEGWERVAKKILRSYLPDKWNLKVVNK